MSKVTTTDLFTPVQLGPLTLANRIVMAPMTRSRSGSDGVPGPMNAQYYVQRASVGLIVSEATNISEEAVGYAFTPGITTDAQIAGWRLVTEAVHAVGGHIFCQLWHVGRVSHPSLQPGGALPVAPSAIKPDARVFTENGFQPCVTPRALDGAEIPGVIDQYRHATEAAKLAGFDGVEVLAGGGYLIDQFLKDKTNRRTDEYGGSIFNRVRFMAEVVDAVAGAWSADRIGIRLGPVATVGDIDDSDPEPLFHHVMDVLSEFGLAYAHVMEGVTPGQRDPADTFDWPALRRRFSGLYIANNGYTLDLAQQARRTNQADLVSFAMPLIANPDLVHRFQIGAPLAQPDVATIYGGDSRGYTDYPALATPQDSC